MKQLLFRSGTQVAHRTVPCVIRVADVNGLLFSESRSSLTIRTITTICPNLAIELTD